MDTADIDLIDDAQACLCRARAGSGETGMSSLASELMHHLDMVLRVQDS
jgi:hypothetical protein